MQNSRRIQYTAYRRQKRKCQMINDKKKAITKARRYENAKEEGFIEQ
jgi:hypothetical protein